MKGKIIVITGTDGSGKETQTKNLFSFLSEKGANVKSQSFPNYESQSSGPVKMYLGGELSKTANEVDAYQASSLFAVDRLCTMKKYNEFLQDGGILLLDRYMESNYFHQVGKIADKEKQDEFLNWLENFEFNVLKIPRPDLIIFLDMPPQLSIALARARQGLKNGEKQDIHECDTKHLETAYKNGLTLAVKNGWKIIPCYKNENGENKNKYGWRKFPDLHPNATVKSIDEIQSEIRKVVGKFLTETKEKEKINLQ